VPVNVDAVMRNIEDDVRRARRKRLLARGAASEYGDDRIYVSVDSILRRAIEARDHDALLLPELIGDEDSSRLTTHLRFSSHRSRLGPAIVFAKRRILLPAMRWLYEYSLNNFRRQNRLNQVVFACIEELAIENAMLRIRISELEQTVSRLEGRIGGSREAQTGGPPDDGGLTGGADLTGTEK
jgi:hypothetical protein